MTIPEPQRKNPYVYAANDPTTLTDPSGHEGIATYGIIGGSVQSRAAPAASLVATELYFTLFLATAALAAPLVLALVPSVPWSPDLGSTAGQAAIATAALTTTLSAARTAIRACVQNGVPFGSRCGGLKFNVYLPGLLEKETTAHVTQALVAHPSWAELVYGSNGFPRGWYGGDPACIGKGLQDWCDEYPFYSTKQGGPGASLKVVPAWQQRIQAGSLTSLYTDPRCGMVKDDPKLGAFLVIPGLTPVTTHYCKASG